MTTTNLSVFGSGPIWAPENIEDKVSENMLLKQTWETIQDRSGRYKTWILVLRDA
jgi:hypothetical protein